MKRLSNAEAQRIGVLDEQMPLPFAPPGGWDVYMGGVEMNVRRAAQLAGEAPRERIIEERPAPTAAAPKKNRQAKVKRGR